MSATPAPPARNRIFINYRREDSEVVVGRLAADLRRVFEDSQVFQDVSSIVPGAKFAVALRHALETSAAVLVIIGPGWLSAKDAQGRRRLDLASDWVRREVSESLKADDVRVFPVLLGNNTTMPAADELPEDLQSLTELQAFPVTTRHWDNDIDALIGFLKRVPGLGAAPVSVPLPGPVSAPSGGGSTVDGDRAAVSESPKPVVSPPRGGSETEKEGHARGSDPGSAASTNRTAERKLPSSWLPYVGVGVAAVVALGLFVSNGSGPSPVLAPAAVPAAPLRAAVAPLPKPTDVALAQAQAASGAASGVASWPVPMKNEPAPASAPSAAAAARLPTQYGLKLWAVGTTLRVRLIKGTPQQHARAERAAQEWTRYANVRFRFGDEQDAEIRISFDPSSGAWSMVGTDALGVPLSQPTMNLGIDTEGSALHEFGHALGLIHENSNPNARLPWDTQAVYRTMTNAPNFWDRRTVDTNLFEQLTGIEYRPFDADSIMMFGFPASYFTDSKARGGGQVLSASDKQFIAKLYPRR